MLVTFRRRAADERGSLVIALAVIMVMTSLSIAVLARTINGLTNSRQGQDTLAAQAAADAGLADAMFQLDNMTGAPPTIPATGPPQSGTLSPGVSFRYRATRQDDNTYMIVSTGASGAMTHSVSVLAQRTPLYPFALFANHGITFNGASAANYSSIFSFQLGIFASTPGRALIGSNHAIVLASGMGGGDAQWTMAPSGSCSGCAHPVTQPGPFLTPDQSVPSLTSPGVCPSFSGPGVHTIVSGVYLCSGDLTLSGTINVAGPVVIYEIPPAGGASTLTLTGLSMLPSDIPTNLQIFKSGPGSIVTDTDTDSFFGFGSDRVTFIGVLYAPESSLNSPNCGMSIRGSITVDTFICDGEFPSLSLAYDSGVGGLLSDRWSMANYREVATPASL
jgi:hypothetical protein